MTMKLEVNGIQYDHFTSASCEIRLDALSNVFAFEAVAAEGESLPIKGGDSCRVIVNGNVVLTGFIEIIDVSYDATGHFILIQGRDKTGDLLDSTVGPINDLRAPITLDEVIKKIIFDIGADIDVVNEFVNLAPFDKAQDIVSPEPGDNAFAFIEKYSRKRNVLLTSNGEGNLVITSGSGDTEEGSIQHIIGASDNNVIAASFSFDTTGRYNSYVFTSQLNPVALNEAGETSLASSVSQSAGVSDNEIRSGRQLFITSETPFSNAQNEDRARWEANIRKARGRVYSATVMGYGVDASDFDSRLWQINRLYQIVDDYLGKSEPMLCNSVRFQLDPDNGETTILGFVDENAYSLELEDPNTSTTAELLL